MQQSSSLWSSSECFIHNRDLNGYTSNPCESLVRLFWGSSDQSKKWIQQSVDIYIDIILAPK
jgi:hypothetical protein